MRPQSSEVAHACAAFEVNTPDSSTGWVSTGRCVGSEGTCSRMAASKEVDSSRSLSLEVDSFLFFLSCVSKTQPNHWTKRMANTRLAT